MKSLNDWLDEQTQPLALAGYPERNDMMLSDEELGISTKEGQPVKIKLLDILVQR